MFFKNISIVKCWKEGIFSVYSLLGRIGQMEPGEWIGKMSLCLIAMK